MRNMTLMVMGVAAVGAAALAAPLIPRAPSGDAGPATNIVAQSTAGDLLPQNAVRDGTGVQSSVATESIDVQARRLPNGAPVAVNGTIRTVSGATLILDRPDGRVHARLPGAIDTLRRGDEVTVYGHLQNHGERIAVRTDAVLLVASDDAGRRAGRLFMPPPRLQSVAARNTSVARGEARNALDHYRRTFAPL